MFNCEDIKRILKCEIEKGNESFVIYPMGKNGVMVKNVLRDYFERKPVLTVDNEWSKYNNEVIDFETFKARYKDEYNVILTIEDESLNEKMLSALYEVVPEYKILNLIDTTRKPKADDFKLTRLFPGYEKNDLKVKRDGKSEKIRIRFIHNNFATFNSIETICEAFATDSRFDLLVILGQNMGDDKDIRFVEQVKGCGYKYVFWDEYKAENDKPDILVVSQAYDWDTVLPGIENYLTLTVATCNLLIRNVQSITAFLNHIKRGFERFNPDYYIFDHLVCKYIKEIGCYKDNMVEMGNAKFDLIWRDTREKRYLTGWDKLKGKRTVLWGIDHGVMETGILSGFTFDLFANKVFAWMNEHTNIGLIFRPHDRLRYEMKKLGFWTENDFLSIKKYFEQTPNMVYDDSPTYGNAYSVADGIIADAICGMSVSALATNKPLCLAYRSRNDISMHKELTENLYNAYCPEEAINFIEMVSKTEDPRKDDRDKIRRIIINALDGGNGKRIKNFIVEKYYNKLQKINVEGEV